MSLKGYLAKLGFTTAAAGSAAVLAFSAGSDLDAPNRTGWYADIATPGSEHLGLVAGGVESARALTTGFDVFGELRVTTANGGLLRMTNTGLTYNPSAVGHNFEISRDGHFITSRVSGNYASFRFSRSAALRVGATSDGVTRGFLVMEGNHPLRVTIDGTDVGRFLKTQLSIDVATASTSTTTGALVVAGGVGIGGDVHIGGGVTVTGLVGSTGLALSPVEANPGGVLGDSTLWVDSENDDTLMYGAVPVTASTELTNSYIGFGSSENLLTGVDTFTYDPAVKTLTFHNFAWRQIEGSVSRNLWLGHGGTFNTGTSNGVFIGINIPNIPNSASNSVWIGNGGAAPVGDRSLTVGRPSYSTARNAVNIGSQGGASGLESVCLGYQAYAAHANSVAVGREATTAKANQIVLGSPSHHTEVFIPVTTASTDTTTGALVVAGGVGIGGDLSVAGDINLPLTGGVLYMDGGAVKAITLTSGLYSPLVQADGTVTQAPTLSGLFLDTQVSGGVEPPYSVDSPLLSIRAAFNDGGGASGTPGVEVGVRPVGVTGQYELFVQDATFGGDLISIDYYEGAISATLYGDLKVTSSVEVGAAAWTYYGDPDTDGSWRFGRNGNNTVFQRREVGVWVTKMTVEA